MKVEKVFASRNDRLGTILMNLFQTRSLAERLGTEFSCFWPVENLRRGRCSAAEILDCEKGPSFDLQQEALKRTSSLCVLDTLPNFRAGSAFDFETVESDVTNLVYLGTRPVLLPGDTATAVIAQARSFARTENYHPKVVDAWRSGASAVDPTRCVAIHMRRGDVVDGITEAGLKGADPKPLIGTLVARYADIDSYIRAVDALAPGSPVLVFSDEPKSVEEFARKAHPREVRRPVTAGDLGLTELQQAMVEMLLMGETQAIIGSKSEFSAFGALHGGARQASVRDWIELPSMEAEIRRRFGTLPGADELVTEIMASYADMLKKIRRS